jgi:hypothetical protein
MFSKPVKITTYPLPNPLNYRRINLLNVWKIYWGKLSLKIFSVGRERALEMLSMSLDDGITQLMHKYTQHCP